MKNDAREPYNTCSISRIHLIKSIIANSDQIILSMFYIIKKQPTSNIHHCKMQLNNIVSRQEKELLKLSYVSNWTATHVAY